MQNKEGGWGAIHLLPSGTDPLIGTEPLGLEPAQFVCAHVGMFARAFVDARISCTLLSMRVRARRFCPKI